MNRAMLAIIRKDLQSVTANKRLFLPLLLVPLVMTVVVPSILMAALLLSPDDPDLQGLLSQLPRELAGVNPSLALGKMMFNTILPAFFLMIPIMTASIMAGSSFVGEKERHTLETLLYCPITLRQIFRAKVLAAFFLSMAVSLGSFLVMCLVLETEAVLLLGSLLPPGANWLVTLFLLAPAVSWPFFCFTEPCAALPTSGCWSNPRHFLPIIPCPGTSAGEEKVFKKKR